LRRGGIRSAVGPTVVVRKAIKLTPLGSRDGGWRPEERAPQATVSRGETSVDATKPDEREDGSQGGGNGDEDYGGMMRWNFDAAVGGEQCGRLGGG